MHVSRPSWCQGVQVLHFIRARARNWSNPAFSISVTDLQDNTLRLQLYWLSFSSPAWPSSRACAPAARASRASSWTWLVLVDLEP